VARGTNELFDTIKVKKLRSEVIITDKQRNATKEWLRLLSNNELEKEEENYTKFQQIVLQDILGFSLYEIVPQRDNLDFSIIDAKSQRSLGIEAKGNSVKDLFQRQHRPKKEQEIPVLQLYTYMGGEHVYDYGICTNYEKFILLIHNKGHSKHHLIDFLKIREQNDSLNEEKLKEFVGLFSKQRIFDEEILENLLKESELAEQEFTKEFYKLYHETRLMLIKEFSNQHDITKDEAIHWSQIFINRLIFIFFAEDNNLIPERIFTKRIIDILKSPSIDENTKSVFDNIMALFNTMNDGSRVLGINAFNGGLFENKFPPKIFFMDLKDQKFFEKVKQNPKIPKKSTLVDIEISLAARYNELLNPIIKNLLLMDSFDFTSEVNVNILGHIFEQSISDLEELRGNEISKRKREGVYYTPEYITDYICRNTIIPYLSKNNSTGSYELVQEYIDNIDELEKKFKEIKILDPACGSGAFLIKAVDILLEIFKEIQLVKESRGKYSSGDQYSLTKWNEESEIQKIIENNIFGIDINEESVEITKLSLFLKLVGENKKLIDLSKNIKVGNSLIDNKTVDERAFSWEDEFPEILGKLIEKKGFDIVIGNPPYVDSENMTKYNKKERDFLSKTYKSTKGNWDLYIPFIEKAFNLINENGKVSMITPNKWLSISYGSAIRNIVGKYLHQLSDYSKIKVFEDVEIFPIIFFLSKKEDPILNVKVFSLENKFTESDIKKKVFDGFDNFGIFFSKYINLIIKILEGSTPLGKICDISGAFTTSEAYDLIPLVEDKETYDKQYLKLVNTGTIDNYFPLWGFQPTKYIKKEYTYPVVSRTKLENKFRKRYGKFNKSKVIISGFRHFECFYDKNNEYLAGKSTTVLTDIPKNSYEYFNCILNSKLITFYLKEGFSSSGMDGGINFSPAVISTIPIRNIKENIQNELVKKSDMMFELWNTFYGKKNKFLKLIKQEYNIDQVSNKLDKFYKLDYDEFIKQFNVKLTMDKKGELLDFFEKNKKEILEILEKINKTNEEINEIVFTLYNITKEEKEIIIQSLPSKL